MEKCFKISGRVQRVGFRYWATDVAKNIGGLSGYVCNLHDGDVLIYVSGQDHLIGLFQQFLYKGPLFARVDAVIETPELISLFPPIIDGVFKRL